MSTIYEATIVTTRDNWGKAKREFKRNGIDFGKPLPEGKKLVLSTFDVNGSLFCNQDEWFVKALDDVVAYEENCIEEEPYFFTYINGEWEEGGTSILRKYYNVPPYSNEEEY